MEKLIALAVIAFITSRSTGGGGSDGGSADDGFEIDGELLSIDDEVFILPEA